MTTTPHPGITSKPRRRSRLAVFLAGAAAAAGLATVPALTASAAPTPARTAAITHHAAPGRSTCTLHDNQGCPGSQDAP